MPREGDGVKKGEKINRPKIDCVTCLEIKLEQLNVP